MAIIVEHDDGVTTHPDGTSWEIGKAGYLFINDDKDVVAVYAPNVWHSTTTVK